MSDTNPLLNNASVQGAAKSIADSLKDNPFYIDAIDELKAELGIN